MTNENKAFSAAAEDSGLKQLRAGFNHIERRQWWLWTTVVMVIILLTLAVASFAFPALLRDSEPLYSFNLSQGVRGLVGLILVFNVYVMYQQWQINRIRRELSEQVLAVGRVGDFAEEVYKLAALDPLTGLYNRRAGERRLVEEITRSQRHGQVLTVLMLDLDGLKNVNDKYGHAAGDEMLKSFAGALNRATRGSDVAVRLGGDEFMLVLPECKAEDVQRVMNRLSALRMTVNGELIPISFSAGWANYLLGEFPENLIKRADDALYADKRQAQDRTRLIPQTA